jgi:hypothetical protein
VQVLRARRRNLSILRKSQSQRRLHAQDNNERRDTRLDFRYAVLASMADEKKKSGTKDMVLWIITVVLVAVAFFLYKR